jgi:hypothetical protein
MRATTGLNGFLDDRGNARALNLASNRTIDEMVHPTRFKHVASTFGGQSSALVKCADLFAAAAHVFSATI